jgi:hypothetical protein
MGLFSMLPTMNPGAPAEAHEPLEMTLEAWADMVEAVHGRAVRVGR